MHPVYGTHGRSYALFITRITNPELLPPVDPEDDYVLCYVLEKVINLFNPSAPYTGNWVSPFGPQECAGEIHDTFDIETRSFTGARDGYFEGNLGATRNNNYEFFSFPTSGEAFLYHLGLFHKDDLTMELVNFNSASLSGSSNPTKSGAQCHPTNPNGYCMNFGFMGGNAPHTSLNPVPIPHATHIP